MKNYLKLLLIIFVLFIANNITKAENIDGLDLDKAKYIPKNYVARTLVDFSSDSPCKDFEAEILQKSNMTTNTDFISKGFVKGKVIKVVNEKIGKQDAYFLFIITEYKADKNSEYKEVNYKNPVKVKPYKPFDTTDAGIKVGANVAERFVKNVTYPINFTRGLVDPYDDKNRLESAVQRTYEGSYFSYASKGKKLIVQKGNLVSVSLKGEEDNSKETTQDTTQNKE